MVGSHSRRITETDERQPSMARLLHARLLARPRRLARMHAPRLAVAAALAVATGTGVGFLQLLPAMPRRQPQQAGTRHRGGGDGGVAADHADRGAAAGL